MATNPKIQLDPNDLLGQANDLDNLTRDFDTLFSNVHRTLENTNGNWSEFLAHNFSGKIASAQNSFSSIKDLLSSGAEAARNSALTFQSLDQSLSNQFGKSDGSNVLSNMKASLAPGDASAADTSTTLNDKMGLTTQPGMESIDDDIDFLKSYLKALKEATKAPKGKKDVTSKGLGLNKDVISLIESFINFFTEDKSGLTGIKNWLNLFEDSGRFWTSWYDYRKQFYIPYDPVLGKKSFIDVLFSDNAQAIVEGAGVGISFAAFISKLCGAKETIKQSDNMSTAEKVGEYIGVGGEALTDFGFSLAKTFHKGSSFFTNGGNAEVGNAGLYSPASLWTAFGKTIIATGAQAIKSVGKYNADGSIDVLDLSKVGIESSTAGLGSMFDSLTFGLGKHALSIGTLGFLSSNFFTGENIGTTLINAADYSVEAIRFGAASGTQANMYLSQHNLMDEYNNSGPIKKLCMSLGAANLSLLDEDDYGPLGKIFYNYMEG